MEKKYLNNSIISFTLIVSIILTPLSFIPQKAEAQSLGGYVSGLAPAIAQLPQCSDIRTNIIGNLFGNIPDIGISSTGDRYTIDDVGDAILDDVVVQAGNSFTGIEVYNPTGAKNDEEIKRELKKIKESTEAINANSSCIQSIGRLIIKTLLQKLTVSTVNWINSGFDGSPAFVQDPAKFFGDIAKNEILQFGIEINNPELFPFGKTWMRNTAAAFNNKFQDNARYSLNELIQNTTPEYSATTFQQDFSQGGWNAWTAMTQVPANNPLGFKLMADNEIQRRLAGTTQSTAEAVHEALSAANGFLGDQRCVSPEGVTKEEHQKYLEGEKDARKCEKFEYVTPGKLISEAATTAINYTNNAYLNVEDLNDAVAAISDALLGQFSQNIFEKGFVNIGNEGADGTLVFSGLIDEPYRSQTEKDFTPIHLTSSWLSSNPNFDIRKDLTQALIDEQRTYSNKLALQNKELKSTTDGQLYKISNGVSNAYGLIPAINQLDYCIPGPHPGWENDSRRALSAAIGTILPETKESLEDTDLNTIIGVAQSLLPMAGAAAGAAIGSVVPVLGTVIGATVGAIVGLLVGLFKDDGEVKVKAYYASWIAGLTGYLPNYDRQDDRSLNIASKAGISGVLNTILSRYAEIIDKTYFANTDMLPSVAKEATTNFNQLVGYEKIIEKNEEKIALLKNTINTLGEIKDEVDSLNTKLKITKEISETEYEEMLKAQINAFGRLSSEMVDGNDIASADNLLKQIIDKKDYVYNNLLKGPYGCEAELEKGPKTFPAPWDSYNTLSAKRMTYPFPVLYDYNILGKGVEIPDPWQSGFKNKMYDDKNTKTIQVNTTTVIDAGGGQSNYEKNKITINTSDLFGPGFLSFVFFSSEGDAARGPERLKIHDILPQDYNFYSRHRAVGLRYQPVAPAEELGGPFETTIGVY